MNGNVEKLNRTLFEVKKLFEDIGEEFFLSRGTLLQVYRSGKFNIWDDDIDVGSFADVSKKEVRKKILNKVVEHGFNYNKTDDASEFRLGLDKRGCMAVGIAFWREVNGFIRESNTNLEYDDIGAIKELREIEFLGDKFLIPNKPEYLLEKWYGDWKQIARKGWCTINEDGEYILYEDWRNAYRVPGTLQYYIKCDENGDYIKPLQIFKKTQKKEPLAGMYRVGLTFGAFDLFHKGHDNLLKSAKYKSRKLIVCVSDDEYIKTIKKTDPIKSFDERCSHVMNSGFVDKVDVQSLKFSKKEAIEKYKPDAIFVGNDWNEDTFGGEEFGVPVIYLEYTKGISTTILKERMKKND